jgi:Bacterial protein of unknown function (DUF882)
VLSRPVRTKFTRQNRDGAGPQRYNVRVLALITLLALPVEFPADSAAQESANPSAVFDPVAARGAHLSPGEPRVLSKKEEWLREKMLRPDFHLSDAELARALATKRGSTRAHRPAAAGSEPAGRAGQRIEPVTTLYNIWTHEALPILPGQSVESRFPQFLRDHFTNQATHMDTRLVDVLARVAGKFSAKRIDVVSGYRSPKYNLMLRKKGHQVARHSQHMEGNAVDFRVRGVAMRQVLHFVRSLRMGGVGFYPHSQFVHSDTGRIRYWTGS